MADIKLVKYDKNDFSTPIKDLLNELAKYKSLAKSPEQLKADEEELTALKHKIAILEQTESMEKAMAILRLDNLKQQIADRELVEVVHAHWKEAKPGHDILFECSNCGRIISTSWGCCEDEDTKGCNGCDPTEEWQSCPTCGALMDEKDDNHESD